LHIFSTQMNALFSALADPTRRRILDDLRTRGPLSIQELTYPLPMSRQAVTKHLDHLRTSGLVTVRREGRKRLHQLDPAPLRQMEAWLEPYSRFWADRLERLQRHLKEN
jgi:DNA-binding transcriptional ArsR family regulator